MGSTGSRVVLVVAVYALSALPPWPAAAEHGRTVRVSVAPDGSEGDGSSLTAVISTDGRYVVFSSHASNLVPDDTNAVADIFMRDLSTGQTERVSLTRQGDEANNVTGFGSYHPAISEDARFVTFASMASNLVPGDVRNERFDIFLRDRLVGTTDKISLSSERRTGNDESWRSAVSNDGRWVAFESLASNLVPEDFNETWDVFLRDRLEGQTILVSQSSSGEKGSDASFLHTITPDGRFIAFTSAADNLVADDSNGFEDVFVRDMWAGSTIRVNVSSAGEQTHGRVSGVSISADGRYVAFVGSAADLVAEPPEYRRSVYLHDRDADGNGVFDEPGKIETFRISNSPKGEAGNGDSLNTSISKDGRWIGFDSTSSNLVDDDRNMNSDIFLYDALTGRINLASVSTGNEQGMGGASEDPSVSGDGRVIAFESSAYNLAEQSFSLGLNVFVHEIEGAVPTCVDGRYEEGPVSGPIHHRVEPAVGPLDDTLHAMNCSYLVEHGL